MNELYAKVRDAVRDVPGIDVLVIFGSRAQGRPRPDSDLDVAVLPAASGSLPRWRLQASLAAELSELAPGGRVDVVLLDEAPDVLRQQVMAQGVVLLCRDEGAWQRLRVRTMREYGDREWVRRLLQGSQRRRLMEGRTHGRKGRALESLRRVGNLSR